MMMKHLYFDFIEKEFENAKEDLISIAKSDCECYIDAYNEFDEDDKEEYISKYNFAVGNIDNIKTVDQAIEVINELNDGGSSSSTEQIEIYEAADDKFREESSNIESVINIVEKIKTMMEVLKVSTSSKSISTYVTVAANYNNYKALYNSYDLEEDYYSELFTEDSIDEDNEKEVNNFFTENGIEHIEIRISNHAVGTYFDEYYGDRKYNDHNVTILI